MTSEFFVAPLEHKAKIHLADVSETCPRHVGPMSHTNLAISRCCRDIYSCASRQPITTQRFPRAMAPWICVRNVVDKSGGAHSHQRICLNTYPLDGVRHIDSVDRSVAPEKKARYNLLVLKVPLNPNQSCSRKITSESQPVTSQ